MNTKSFFNLMKDKTVAFAGISGSNLPLIKLFKEKGIRVIACDKREKDQIPNVKELGVELYLGKNYLKNLDVDVIFRTPGMNFFLEELVEARKKGIVVTSEMEVFFNLCPCEIFAVTGSDGKTTTTTIIYEMLKKSGKKVHLGGNIGTPLLQKIEEIKEDDIAVVELSSFQLISMRKSPDVAVVTNLSPNHLDVHADMNEYIDAKKNIIIHQDAFSRTVLNLDNNTTKNFVDLVRGESFFFSRKESVKNGAYLNSNDEIIMSINNKKIKVMNKSDIKIPGEHNVENYLAAISAIWGYVNVEDIKEVAMNFSGVEHRTEFVRELNGVKYYNDSIASSPTRTIRGTLSLFDKKIILISGGYDKKIPFEPLGPVIVDKVKILILIGQTSSKIEQAVKKSSNYKEDGLKIIHVSNMIEAVLTARKYALKGDIVSLSPACASFDLYKNFAARGDHFKEIVNSLD